MWAADTKKRLCVYVIRTDRKMQIEDLPCLRVICFTRIQQDPLSLSAARKKNCLPKNRNGG